jgi:hypothetical protein
VLAVKLVAMTGDGALENMAVRRNREDTQFLLSGDWEGYRGRLIEDMVSDDRRKGMTNLVQGRDAIADGVKVMMGIGITDIQSETLAVRGERLALSRVYFYGPEGLEGYSAEVLQVLEFAEDERQSACIFFDPDDLDAATEELEKRYRGSA